MPCGILARSLPRVDFFECTLFRLNTNQRPFPCSPWTNLDFDAALPECLHETHDLLDIVGRSRCPLARPSEEEEHDASLLAAPQR